MMQQFRPGKLFGIKFLSGILIVFLWSCESKTGTPVESANQEEVFRILPGDFLFQDLDCGELCDAIEKVTGTVEGKSFSHVGFVVRKGNDLMVAEAMDADVHLTPLDTFLLRNTDSAGHYKIFAGRLLPLYQPLIKGATRFIFSALGTPYDDVFLTDNKKYYCSELLYDAFMHANGGKEFFTLSPMTYKDPETGETFGAWTSYYKALGEPIPEGLPGCNPNSIASDSKMKIMKKYY